jgi:hypothetical protein
VVEWNFLDAQASRKEHPVRLLQMYFALSLAAAVPVTYSPYAAANTFGDRDYQLLRSLLAKAELFQRDILDSQRALLPTDPTHISRHTGEVPVPMPRWFPACGRDEVDGGLLDRISQLGRIA